MMILENVIKIFVADTHTCAILGVTLKEYQMKQHQWTKKQWDEYYQAYQNNLNNVGLIPPKP